MDDTHIKTLLDLRDRMVHLASTAQNIPAMVGEIDEKQRIAMLENLMGTLVGLAVTTVNVVVEHAAVFDAMHTNEPVNEDADPFAPDPIEVSEALQRNVAEKFNG